MSQNDNCKRKMSKLILDFNNRKALSLQNSFTPLFKDFPSLEKYA